MTKEEWAVWKTRPKGESEISYLRTSMLNGVERKFDWGWLDSDAIKLQRAQVAAVASGIRVRLQNAVQRLREQA
jgi:hypothetical protein